MGLTTSTGNKKVCGCCGQLSEDHFKRNQTARDGGWDYARMRANRGRLEIIYNMDHLAYNLENGMGDWAGKMACADCCKKYWAFENR